MQSRWHHKDNNADLLVAEIAEMMLCRLVCMHVAICCMWRTDLQASPCVGADKQQDGWEQVAEASSAPAAQQPFTESWAFKGAAIGLVLGAAVVILQKVRRRRWDTKTLAA